MQSHQVETQLKPKTIEDLPEEVLVMIFKLLDLKSLKQTVLTCKMWNLIIDGSISWPLKFPFKIGSVLDSSRKFKKVAFEYPKFFCETRSEIKEIFFENHVLRMTNVDFSDFLQNYPNAEKITLRNVIVVFQGNKVPAKPDLNKLTTLELVNYNEGMLPCFRKAQLKTFKFFGYFECPQCEPEEIESFFASQKSLTACTLNYIADSLLEASQWFMKSMSVENIPFKLEELSLTCFNLAYYQYINLLEFLKIHADSLVTLKLGYTFPVSIYEFVFAKFQKLKTLCLITGSWNEYVLFINDDLEVNRSVTTLALFEHGYQCNHRNAATIIRKLPNIENLVLIIDGAYAALAATTDGLQHLKHLTIQGFDPQFWQSVIFPNLESVKFVEAELERGSDIASVSRNLNLRSMVFDGNVDSDFLKAISENFPELVSLDLKKTTVKAKAVSKQIRGLRLRDDDFFQHPKTSGEFFCERDFQNIRERPAHNARPHQDYYDSSDSDEGLDFY